MHIQMPLALESEKQAILRELFITLPFFPVEYLDALLEAVRARHEQIVRPPLRIHVEHPQDCHDRDCGRDPRIP